MPVPRKRRTAEESRDLILSVAAQRLREQGLDGLNIKGVAEAAGLSHATLIHHFGSSGEMREALADKMTADLIQDLVAAFDARQPPAELCARVFVTLAEGGHAKLLAWRAVEGSGQAANMDTTKALFEQLLDHAQQALDIETEETMRMLVFVVATAALGYGLAGDVLAELLSMPEAETQRFPDWITQRLL